MSTPEFTPGMTSVLNYNHMDGILVIDKPKGFTSHDVVAIIRKLSGEKKVGHLGTLDPSATGVLPLVLGKATKLAESLAGDEKTYSFTLCLGTATETDDAEGAVTETATVPKDFGDRLEKILPSLTGWQTQKPPVYSAIKCNGLKSYEAARRGLQVELPDRKVFIKSLSITGIYENKADMRLECGAGTYVRSLCRDLGRYLGTYAHAMDIRRLKSGTYTIDAATDLRLIREKPDLIIERIVEIS